jgi:3-hydroxy-9,10-secoandrosta-1,3,5(10)-triene-9,17-dione monooxygenase
MARLCIQAVERLYTNSGGSANYNTNPMQRYWRDVHAMGAHVGLNFDSAGEAFGRTELGLPPNPHDLFSL